MKKYHPLLYLWLFLTIGTAKAQYTDLLNFNGPNGNTSYGELAISANTLYGFTCYGGARSDGCIFAIQTNGSGYTDLFDFIGNTGANPHNGCLTFSVTGDTLFGMTANGGSNGEGVIYSIRTNGSGYTDLFNFNGSNGATAYPSLLLYKRKFYSMTYSGGTFGQGLIFSVNTDGSGYTSLHNFSGLEGSEGNAALVNSGDTLYGMTLGGGAYGNGCIFAIQTNGSGYTDLLDFNGSNGSTPYGGLILSASRDTLFGMTCLGGVHNDGLVFSIKTNGKSYHDLLDFNGTNGQGPRGSLTLSTCGTTLMGMTQYGGANDIGNIFSVLTTGGGFVDIYDFNNPKGSSPCDGSLILSNNVLYGITQNGGMNNEGAVFSDTVLPSQQTQYDSINTCRGQNDTLKVSGGISYLWSNGATTSSIIVSPASSATYTATVYGLCESSNKIITLNVHPSPLPEITGTKVKCPGIPDTLAASGGLYYKWSNGSTKINYYTGDINADSTITLIAYNSLGCFHDTTFTITTLPSPKLTITTASVCTGQPDTITVKGGIHYLWSNGSTVTTYYTGNLNADSIVKVTAFNSFGCLHDTTITLHPIPYPKPVITGASSKCMGEIDTITVSGGTSYLWSTGASRSSIIVAPVNTTTYSVILSNGGCIKDTSIQITVDTNQYGNVSGNLSVCKGNSTTLTASGGNSYKWSTGATTSNINVSPNSNESYSVVVMLNGCVDSLSLSVTVKPVPSISACCDSTIIMGQDVQLNSSGNGSYLWMPPTGLSCETCPNPIANPTITTTYTVLSTSDSNCTVTTYVTIIVDNFCFNFNIPNVFTPNGDGVNDQFIIAARDVDNYSITIYDRWGREMFKTTNPSEYWNGNTEGGNKVPDGVYYYILTATCQNNIYKKNGFVQVMR